MSNKSLKFESEEGEGPANNKRHSSPGSRIGAQSVKSDGSRMSLGGGTGNNGGARDIK